MKTWKKLALPLTLGFTLAACESSQDLAKKPALVQQMTENSASLCETGPVHADKASYEERLTKVLMGAKAASLQTLEDRNITVCLDQRLSQQRYDATSFFSEGRMEGVYIGQKSGGVAALWDDGQQPAEASIWSMNAYFRGSDATNFLASSLNKGQQPAESGYMINYEYGRGRLASWLVSDPAKGILRDNPQLRQPPLKKAAPPKPS